MLSLGATGAIVEVFLRVSNVQVDRTRDDFQYFLNREDGAVGFTYKPNLDRDWSGIRLRTNSLGLKDTREPADLDPACRRILMVGGSITAGYGVDDDRAFPQRLEVALNSSGSEACYHVINAGQIAYTAGDIAALARVLTPIYKPDIVIFEVNQFTMNSPYFLNQTGVLQHEKLEGVMYDHLSNFWELKGDRIDLAASVSGAKDPWGFSLWDRQRWWHDSYAYQFFYPRLLGLLKRLGLREAVACADCLELRPTYLRKDGAVERLPLYSPLYLSPLYRERHYRILNQAIAETKVPLVFFTNDFFVDPARLTEKTGVFLVNLSEIVGMPVKKLYEENSLAWDFHLNEKGNELVAQGLWSYLASRELVPLAEPRALDQSTEEFIVANRRQDEAVRARFGSSVDFAGRRRIHQIIAGITPDEQLAPDRVALLLKKQGQKKLSIRGESLAEAPKRFEVRARSVAGELVSEIVIAPGRFQIALRADAVADGVVDLWLTCLETSCHYNRYDLIGFE